MRDRDTRTAILELSKKAHGVRVISRTLEVSRKTVRRVLRSGSAEVPGIERTELAEPHEERIRTLFLLCKGNLVRVHEELAAGNVELPYSTLTAFCRRRCKRSPNLTGSAHAICRAQKGSSSSTALAGRSITSTASRGGGASGKTRPWKSAMASPWARQIAEMARSSKPARRYACSPVSDGKWICA